MKLLVLSKIGIITGGPGTRMADDLSRSETYLSWSLVHLRLLQPVSSSKNRERPGVDSR